MVLISYNLYSACFSGRLNCIEIAPLYIFTSAPKLLLEEYYVGRIWPYQTIQWKSSRYVFKSEKSLVQNR
jgi:hypothetical protein